MSLKNTTTNNSWGLSAVYEEQKLVFSGTFDPKRIRKERWEKFLCLFSKNNSAQFNQSEGQTDIYKLFSYNAKEVWQQAFLHAKRRGSEVYLEDLFLALLKQDSVQILFKRFGADTNATRILLKNFLKLGMPQGHEDELKKVPFEAYALASQLHDTKVGCLMLLGALIKIAPKYTILEAIFSNIGLTLDKLEVISIWQLGLNFQFPAGSTNSRFLDCCRQAEPLEKHFGYFFEFSAIEQTVAAAGGQPNKDTRHRTMLKLLVKAGLLARQNHDKLILADSIQKAYALA